MFSITPLKDTLRRLSIGSHHCQTQHRGVYLFQNEYFFSTQGTLYLSMPCVNITTEAPVSLGPHVGTSPDILVSSEKSSLHHIEPLQTRNTATFSNFHRATKVVVGWGIATI